MTGSRWARVEQLLATEARKQLERRELSIKTRRATAERTGWPTGYVGECEELDERFPGYYSSYFPHAVGWSAPGWYATPWRSPHGWPTIVYGATVAELRSALQAVTGGE